MANEILDGANMISAIKADNPNLVDVSITFDSITCIALSSPDLLRNAPLRPLRRQ